jgi:pimeloyl-ACP methyl ester carboxylesterase
MVATDNLACPPAPPGLSAEPPLTLSAALERYRREARPGVCDTGRYRCPYYVWGDGPPVVFIPGLCDDALSFVPTLALLSRRFRCIAYSLPTGQGDGARLGAYRHADLVGDLFALLDHLRLGQAYLFGSSFGSTVVLVALHAQPGRLPRAVLQGGFARRPLAWAEIALASWARWWPGPMSRLPLRAEILRLSHGAPFCECPPEAWEFFLQRCGAPPMAAVAHRALLVNRLDLRQLLPAIQQPILLICGNHDPLVDRACEQTLLSALPDATRAEIVGCGHLPLFTHPEILAELTWRFLAPLPCAAAESACQAGHPLDSPA